MIQPSHRAALRVVHGVAALRDEAAICHRYFQGGGGLTGRGSAQHVLRMFLGPRQDALGLLQYLAGGVVDEQRRRRDRPYAHECGVAVDHAVVGADE